MATLDEGTPVLCKNCSSLLPYPPFKDGPRRRWVTCPGFPEIKASAKRGCALCPLFLEALGEMLDDQGRPREPWVIDSRWPISNWNHVVAITNPTVTWPKWWPTFVLSKLMSGLPSDEEKELGEIRFELWADAGRGLTKGMRDAGALHNGIPRRLPEKNPLSDANTRRIHGWLDDCVAKHGCCHTKKLPRLPTRVIDVGSSGGQNPRLLATDRRPAQYLALSHCWGTRTASEGHIRLLQSNLQDLLTEIPIASISKNFQDAIEVVRKLKFKYLWIDALCIIQDSKSDWENESARMNDVYECSHLTLVATSAGSTNDGFLERSKPTVVDLPYRDDTDPTIEGTFSISRGVTELSWKLVNQTAWNTRGWTYQERLLSRRLLHFTSSILLWECRAIDSSEINVKKRELDSRPRWILDHPDDDPAAVEPQYLVYSNYDRWYVVLREFTQRNFTYTSDLLPAISGLATIFRQSFVAEDDYIAGLWRRDLAQGLLWLVDDSSKTTKTLLGYWAPSWSWASIAGQVSWPTRTIARHQRDDFTVELLENHLRIAHEDAMGTVLGGYIRMRGRLRQLSCVTKPIEWGAFFRFRYDLWCGDQVVGNGQFDADQDDTAEEVWLLQIKLQVSGDGVIPFHPTALMLERISGSWLKFVRLGCAVLDEKQLDFFDISEPEDFNFY